jgi:hypothetical protein
MEVHLTTLALRYFMFLVRRSHLDSHAVYYIVASCRFHVSEEWSDHVSGAAYHSFNIASSQFLLHRVVYLAHFWLPLCMHIAAEVGVVQLAFLLFNVCLWYSSLSSSSFCHCLLFSNCSLHWMLPVHLQLLVAACVSGDAGPFPSSLEFPSVAACFRGSNLLAVVMWVRLLFVPWGRYFPVYWYSACSWTSSSLACYADSLPG